MNRAPQQQRLGEDQQRDDQRDPARERPLVLLVVADEAAAAMAPAIGSAIERGQNRKRHQRLNRHRRVTVIATGNTPGSATTPRNSDAAYARTEPVCTAAAARCMPPTDLADAVHGAVDDRGRRRPSTARPPTRCGSAGRWPRRRSRRRSTCSAAARARRRSARPAVGRTAGSSGRRTPRCRCRRARRAIETAISVSSVLVGRVVSAAASLARAATREARLEELLEPVRPAERVRQPDVAGDDRADREHDQRERHRRRRIVQMAVPPCACAVRGMRCSVPGASALVRCAVLRAGARRSP